MAYVAKRVEYQVVMESGSIATASFPSVGLDLNALDAAMEAFAEALHPVEPVNSINRTIHGEDTTGNVWTPPFEV